jgi:hypothetical protein
MSNPTIREGAQGAAGVQQVVTMQVGPPLLVDGATYKANLFIAPCDGCYIKELKAVASVAIAGGTSTLAVDNYDKSASSARNVLSTTNIDPTTVTPALKGFELTLTATDANRWMDEGDALNATLVCGTMTTDGQAFMLQAIIVVPEVM